MIKVVLFDVGETLIHDGNAIPGVVDALTTISKLKTAEGEPLLMGIVSNYYPVPSPVTEEKILALEKRYRTEILEPTGLTALFEPFDSKVTISSRAGVSKPEKEIFTTALTRLHPGTKFDECVFITEEEAHLKKAKEYGILPIGFGGSISGIKTFSDWTTAPLLLAGLVAPNDVGNLALSAVPALDSQHDLCEFTPTSIKGRTVEGTANQLFQLNDPRLGALSGVYVERPIDVTLEMTPNGSLEKVEATEPDSEEVAEAVNYVHTLIAGGRIGLSGKSKGTTHIVEKDSNGRDRLIRTRFSAQ